jgi:hypothetical protein
MLSYVNHQAVRDAFRPIEVEQDPVVRSELMKALLSELCRDIFFQYSKAAFELKKRKNWNTGQIAEFLNVSERHAKRLIREYCNSSGEWNPLQRRAESYDFTDITALVRVKKET